MDTHTSSPSIINSRRSSLAISALLNDVSIDPMQHPLAPNTTTQLPWNHDVKFRLPSCLPLPSPSPMDYSPISSGSSSPNGSLDSFSRHSSITEPPDLWSHSRTGMHQTNNGIIVSSLAKAKRKRILPHQYKRLMETFEKTDTPSSEIRSKLADELDMTKREVQVNYITVIDYSLHVLIHWKRFGFKTDVLKWAEAEWIHYLQHHIQSSSNNNSSKQFDTTAWPYHLMHRQSTMPHSVDVPPNTHIHTQSILHRENQLRLNPIIILLTLTLITLLINMFRPWYSKHHTIPLNRPLSNQPSIY